VGEVDLASFRALLSPDGERVLEEVAARGGADERTMLGTLTALRRRYDAGLVSAALTQVRLRDRAQAKFGADAAGMYFTPAGVEQATRAVVAERHARRYADAGVLRVLDLCCGIGGDLVAFARAGLRVHGVDRDPLTLEVARANAAALGVAEMVTLGGGDVAEVPLGGWPAALPLPRHVIMLGTPNRPPRLARRLQRLWPYRLVNGECGRLLARAEFFTGLPPMAVPCTIVAGTGGWRGGWSPFGHDAHDGVVAVAEAEMDGPAFLAQVPVRHTFMMNDRRVRALLLNALDGVSPSGAGREER